MSTACRYDSLVALNNLQTIVHVSLVRVSTSRIVCRRVQDMFKLEEDEMYTTVTFMSGCAAITVQCNQRCKSV